MGYYKLVLKPYGPNWANNKDTINAVLETFRDAINGYVNSVDDLNTSGRSYENLWITGDGGSEVAGVVPDEYTRKSAVFIDSGNNNESVMSFVKDHSERTEARDGASKRINMFWEYSTYGLRINCGGESPFGTTIDAAISSVGNFPQQNMISEYFVDGINRINYTPTSYESFTMILTPETVVIQMVGSVTDKPAHTFTLFDTEWNETATASLESSHNVTNIFSPQYCFIHSTPSLVDSSVLHTETNYHTHAGYPAYVNQNGTAMRAAQYQTQNYHWSYYNPWDADIHGTDNNAAMVNAMMKPSLFETRKYNQFLGKNEIKQIDVVKPNSYYETYACSLEGKALNFFRASDDSGETGDTFTTDDNKEYMLIKIHKTGGWNISSSNTTLFACYAIRIA